MANAVRTIQTAGRVRAVRGFLARPYGGVLVPPTVKPTIGVLWPPPRNKAPA